MTCPVWAGKEVARDGKAYGRGLGPRSPASSHKDSAQTGKASGTGRKETQSRGRRGGGS